MKRVLRPNRKDFTLRLLGWFYNLLEGDHGWAERRSILLYSAVLIFLLMGRATEQITNWWLLQPYIDALPAPVVLALSLVHPQTLRHALPPLIGLLLALGMAANYVRDLFELADLETGNRYLNAAMFGSGYPAISIRGGKYEVSEGGWGLGARPGEVDTNPISKIGGPGYVIVSPGNVALFERVGGPSKVAGAGQHFIRRFETLREVVDLRDQFRERAEVRATTKDGMPVVVEKVQVSFRVRTSNRPRTQREAYPFSISAVRGIAYGKTVSAKGPSLWTDSVPNTVASIIRDYISRTLLDDLITGPEVRPESASGNGQSAEAETVDHKTRLALLMAQKEKQKDPRDKLKAVLESTETRHKFNAMGVDLLWVSLGHIKTPTDVLDKYTKTWGAKWHGEAIKKLAEGNAHKLRAMGIIRAFAQIGLVGDMIKSVPLSPDKPPDFDVVLLQIAETLTLSPRPEQEKLSQVQRLAPMSDTEIALLKSQNASQLLNEMGFGIGSVTGSKPALTDDPPTSSTES